jgi:murein DD-endopeptidase MepM/ murein hydrolase activator NlpD
MGANALTKSMSFAYLTIYHLKGDGLHVRNFRWIYTLGGCILDHFRALLLARTGLWLRCSNRSRGLLIDESANQAFTTVEKSILLKGLSVVLTESLFFSTNWSHIFLGKLTGNLTEMKNTISWFDFREGETSVMWKSRKAIGAIVVTSILLGSATFPTVTSADQLQDSQQQLKKIQQDQQLQKQHIQQLQSQENSISDQIKSIDNDLQVTERKIADLQAELAQKEQQINQLKDQITRTEKAIQTRNEILRQRVRVMYENGSTSYLDVILSSTSFSDFLDRVSTLSIIAEQDKKILTEIKKQREDLQNQQNQLVVDQQQRQQTYNQLQAMRNLQEQQKSQKEVALSQVHDQRVKEQQDLNEEQAAMDEIAAKIQAIIAAQQAAAKQNSMNQNSSEQQHGSGNWGWPVPSSHVISSGYGPREGGEFHKGIDIAAPVGTPIVAVADGTVLFSGPASGFGHWVVIQHDGGVMSVYGHMYGDEIYVSAGEQVKAGQKIAAVGSDGESSGPHLHFAVATGISDGRMNYVNPWNYLK